MSNPKNKEKQELHEFEADEIEEEDGDEELEEEEKEERSKKRTCITIIVQAVALTTVVFAVLAIIFSNRRIITGVAAAVSIPLSGFVVVRQCLLNDTDAMRNIQNKIRRQVNRLQKENNILSAEVTQLEGTVNRLEETEQHLQKLTEKQGTNVNKLVALVKENGEVQQKMMKIIKTDTLQNFYNVLLSVDRDADYHIEKREAKELVTRLKADTRINIKEDLLYQRIQEAGGKLLIRHLRQDLMEASEEVVASKKKHADKDHIFSFNLDEFHKAAGTNY